MKKEEIVKSIVLALEDFPDGSWITSEMQSNKVYDSLLKAGVISPEPSASKLSMSMFATKEAYDEAVNKTTQKDPLEELEEWIDKKIEHHIIDRTNGIYNAQYNENCIDLYKEVLSKITSLKGE